MKPETENIFSADRILFAEMQLGMDEVGIEII
jgi:hypothetical protein